MAAGGALSAVIIGMLQAREGIVISLALLLGLGLVVYACANSINGIRLGIAIVVMIPYWYGKGGITVLQLGCGFALLTIVPGTMLRRAELRWTWVDLAVCALIVAALLDWFLRHENFLALRATLDTIVPITFYFGGRLLGERSARLMLGVLVGAGALASLTLFYEFARGSSVFISPTSYYWTAQAGVAIFRPGGVFGAPPTAVTILSMATLAGLPLLRGSTSRARRLLLAALALMVGGGLITFARAGWIGFGAGALWLVLLMWWRGGMRLPRRLLFVPVAGVIAALLLPVLAQSSWFQYGVQRGGTLAVREDYWSQAATLILDNPEHLLIGRGLNSLVVAGRTGLGAVDPSYAENPNLITAGAHNQYLRTLLEQGAVGLLITLAWLVGPIVLAVRRLPRLPEGRRWLLAGLTAAVVSFLVVSLAGTSLRDPDSFAVISLLTGLTVSLALPAAEAAL